jgi:endonuclease/exonuclease/phosphatase family metal-dependent hydrolase
VTRLRLITWNLHGSAKPRIDAVVELLQAHEPDVLALQEVRSGQARRIAGLLRWRRSAWSLKHNAWWPLWWRGEGLAVLSRHKLAVHPTVVLTPGVSKRSYERRILVPAEVVLDDDQRVLLIDAHLSSGGTEEARRSEQAEHLLRLLPESPPSVVAGDLNADPDRAPIRILVDAGLVDAWAAAGSGPGHTIPANAPRRRIDYVLAGPGVSVVEAAVLDDLGPAMAGLSDHRPVLAVLDVPSAEPPPPSAEPG